MKYVISQDAKNDLEEIWYYTFRNWSKEQADRYFNMIMDEIEFLAINPSTGHDFRNIRQGYLKSKVKSHLIFYRVNEMCNQVEIIRILHQRMDIENRLGE